MKKFKMLVAITLCMAVLATCALAVNRILYPADISMSASYSMARSGENKLALNVTLNDGDKEIAIPAKIFEDSSLKKQLETTNTPIENHMVTYSATTNNRLSEVYVVPPVLFSPETCDKITVNLLSEEKETNDVFSVVDFEEVSKEQDGEQYKALIVSVEAVGNGDKFPRFPKLLLDGTTIVGTTSLNFTNEGYFVNGMFAFELPEDYDGYDNLEIEMNDILIREEAVAQEVSVR